MVKSVLVGEHPGPKVVAVVDLKGMEDAFRRVVTPYDSD